VLRQLPWRRTWRKLRVQWRTSTILLGRGERSPGAPVRLAEASEQAWAEAEVVAQMEREVVLALHCIPGMLPYGQAQPHAGAADHQCARSAQQLLLRQAVRVPCPLHTDSLLRTSGAPGVAGSRFREFGQGAA